MICSFIVSTYNRPRVLEGVLTSLAQQTEQSFEVIVADNSDNPSCIVGNHEAVARYDDRFRLIETRLSDCYRSANAAAQFAIGEYVCFPSDDCYYCPRFLEQLIQRGRSSDLIYCNCIWDGLGSAYPGSILVARLCLGGIDKGGFLLRRWKFTGFPEPPADRADRVWPGDGIMIEQLVKAGVHSTKVDQVLWVHN